MVLLALALNFEEEVEWGVDATQEEFTTEARWGTAMGSDLPP